MGTFEKRMPRPPAPSSATTEIQAICTIGSLAHNDHVAFTKCHNLQVTLNCLEFGAENGFNNLGF